MFCANNIDYIFYIKNDTFYQDWVFLFLVKRNLHKDINEKATNQWHFQVRMKW